MEGAGRGRGQMEGSPHRFLVHMEGGGGRTSSISRPHGGGGGGVWPAKCLQGLLIAEGRSRDKVVLIPLIRLHGFCSTPPPYPPPPPPRRDITNAEIMLSSAKRCRAIKDSLLVSLE